MKKEEVDILVSKIDESIGESVDRHINDKINKLTQKLDDYIESDNEWKKKYEPYIEGLANISGGAKILVWIAIGVSAIIGAFLAIKNVLK